MVVSSDAKLMDKSSLRTDFPEFQPKRPTIAKLTDNLKIEGLVGLKIEDVLSNDSVVQYLIVFLCEYSYIFIRKISLDLIVCNAGIILSICSTFSFLHSSSLQSGFLIHIHISQTNPFFIFILTILKRNAVLTSVYSIKLTEIKCDRSLDFNLKGDADLMTAYNKSYVQQQPTERPEIKRMHSNLAVGAGRFAGLESVGRVDYPQHDVSRPVIMKPVNNLSVYEGSYHRNEVVRRSWSTPVNDVVLPAMNRAKQMQSSIHFGSDYDFPGQLYFKISFHLLQS